ncbi:hypothetical protein CEUSTIGMA_g13928.t1, partial [Chlamydomonas eustigma]
TSDDSSITSFDHAQFFGAMHSSPYHHVQQPTQLLHSIGGNTSDEEEPQQNPFTQHALSMPWDSSSTNELPPDSSTRLVQPVTIPFGEMSKDRGKRSEGANPREALLKHSTSITGGLMPGPEAVTQGSGEHGPVGPSEEGLWQSTAATSHQRAQATSRTTRAVRVDQLMGAEFIVNATATAAAAAAAPVPTVLDGECSAFFKSAKGSARVSGATVDSSSVSSEAPMEPNNTAQHREPSFVSHPNSDQGDDSVAQLDFHSTLACNENVKDYVPSGCRGGKRQYKKPSEGVTWHPNPLQDAPILKDQSPDHSHDACEHAYTSTPCFEPDATAAYVPTSIHTFQHLGIQQAPARVQAYPRPLHSVIGAQGSVQQARVVRLAHFKQESHVPKPGQKSKHVREAHQAFTLMGTGSRDIGQQYVDNSNLHL